MNHIKNYKLFEGISDKLSDVEEILFDLFDKYNYTSLNARRNSYITYGSNTHGSIDISNSHYFGSECIKIRITENGSSNSSSFLKSGNFKGFDGVTD